MVRTRRNFLIGCRKRQAALLPPDNIGKEQLVQPLDPEQLKFVEILAKLMLENEVFKEEYSEKDFDEVIDWLTKLRAQLDITIEALQDQGPSK